MNKLGIDNFYLEVIECCSVEELNKKELYYIDFYDSWKNGYNNGNSSNFLEGEKNPNAKLNNEDIRQIRIRQSYLVENRREIYEDFKDKITWTNFLFVCKYQIWPDILKEYNTEEIMNWHKKQLGNESRKMPIEDIENIVKLRYKEKKTYSEIAKIYNKNPKTISRIINEFYYKEEMELLKIQKPELFQS